MNSDEDVSYESIFRREYEEQGYRSTRRNYSFSNEMSDKLNKLRKDKTYCDVILRSGLREVYAHRIILATLSDYFTLLFKYEGGFDNPVIVLDEHMITGDCLESIVSYAYTGEIAICNRNVCDLLMAADYFDIPFIRSECEKILNESDIITLDNLSNLIWMVCHYNLTTFLEPTCKFVSKHFAEISETVLLNLSPHCLFTLLRENNLTVLYNGIPADDVEFELFKLLVNYINKYDLSDYSINELLRVIRFSEITSKEFPSIVKSSPRISNNEAIIAVSNFHALPSFVEEKTADNLEQRKCSRAWKHIRGLKEDEVADISLDDRISKIKIYTLNGIPSAKTRKNLILMNDIFSAVNPLQDVEDFSSVKGISLTYRSGENVTIGDITDEAVFPLDEVCSEELTLNEKEVIVNISMTVKDGLLKSIKFTTNIGSSTTALDHNLYYSQTISPKWEYGYFHSFGKDSTIDSLKFLWVEYRDPKLRQYGLEDSILQLLQQRHERMLFAQMFSTYEDQDYGNDFAFYDNNVMYIGDDSETDMYSDSDY